MHAGTLSHSEKLLLHPSFPSPRNDLNFASPFRFVSSPLHSTLDLHLINNFEFRIKPLIASLAHMST